MIDFKQFVHEAAIETFMSKIGSCMTLDGLKELEGYYKKRSGETELGDSDDISIRDALAGKRTELESMDDEEDEDF
ncbi:DNA helicase [Escherichia phage EcS1]|uniref:RNA-DNA and DNA-DNA helicase n=1 Tax=Escherichia phage EcS1 TaxID=2083276 RepID=A0A2Z5ZC69_9CAUD|nr:DNA helicase [Escherichia phage EcS1]BBC78250.1 RNA-DNA and DNA-DNA helicase [Escherichia phage EcS1]